jgi:LysM repeat protein
MDRRRRSPARFLAPLFLIAVIVAAVIVVQDGRKGTGGDASTSTTQNGSSSTTKSGKTLTTSKSSKSSKAKTYTVKSGDSLSGVAARTGVSIERIQQLNPKLDAQSLQVGQKIKLSGPASDQLTP